MEPIVLDTDPGIDDALAMMLAFNSPEISVSAVTTVAGNVSHAKAHVNAKKLLEYLGEYDIPVCEGAERPLLRGVSHVEDFHGDLGLGDAILPEPGLPTHELNAVEMIIRKADELMDKLTIVSIGPLTNIASAILADPELPLKINKLVIMGGAYQLTPYGHGNSTAVAEFNIWHDPEAAKIVFDSDIKIVAVGLDVTTNPRNRLNRRVFREICSTSTENAGLVESLCRELVDRLNGCSLHDPMATAYLIKPGLFKLEKHRVKVETRGELTRGMTVVDRRYGEQMTNDHSADIVVEVDGRGFLDIFLERVVGG
ncbi:MAG: nucleoside hydrolase [Candidatus Bathyarchaeia archaeon]